MNRKLIATLAASAATAFASPAFAALTATGVACDGQSTTMTSLTGYMDCSGAWSGNNSNQSVDVAAQILADWGLVSLVSTDVTGGNTGSTGTLSFAAQTGVFVLALKAGDAFSLYELDGSAVAGGISSISYDTLGVGFFSGPNNNMHFGQGLSHADIYTTPVPEPETWALMFGGLGVLALLNRRKKQPE
ncbi:PEP-CTERM sorting domain-containing protein [Ideonella sp. BN130291]|uniref:PEP-CTERM sorting domain-containing protein n=1 Tax=Ideonella sp. BN130291 TaxID=3112940 RepID=UPI002E26F0DA|nr:PEP-CTERM sorting domain-containing protein [Ideonella sp. BN130291]